MFNYICIGCLGIVGNLVVVVSFVSLCGRGVVCRVWISIRVGSFKFLSFGGWCCFWIVSVVVIIIWVFCECVWWLVKGV